MVAIAGWIFHWWKCGCDMKNISGSLNTHIQGESTTLTMCWKLTLRSGAVMGFTSHDRDINYAGVTYQAASGFTPSAVANSADFAVDNMEVEGVLDALTISEGDLLAGKYDFAELEVFLLNYADTSQGVLKLRRGWLGEVSISQGRFVAEVRGLMQRLAHTIGELYSPACRATLGDARCKVAIAGYTVTGSITGITSQRVLKDTTRAEAAGYFTFGKITFTSGQNNGLSMEVKEYMTGVMVLTLPMPKAVTVGDSYTLTAGCDQTFETCCTRFSNATNFRGEPHVPGAVKMYETSSTRSV